jgi:hypothetical protein
LGDIGGQLGDATAGESDVERFCVTPNADDSAGEIALAKSKTNGAADETHADDRDGVGSWHKHLQGSSNLLQNTQPDLLPTGGRED